jgi:hypothetical protein
MSRRPPCRSTTPRRSSRPEGTFSGNHRPEEGRHLLRDAEPAGCRQATGRSSEVVLVVGSRSSSNSNRLREVAELIGSRAYLVDQAEQIDPAWLKRRQPHRRHRRRVGTRSPGSERRRSTVGGRPTESRPARRRRGDAAASKSADKLLPATSTRSTVPPAPTNTRNTTLPVRCPVVPGFSGCGISGSSSNFGATVSSERGKYQGPNDAPMARGATRCSRPWTMMASVAVTPGPPQAAPEED